MTVKVTLPFGQDLLSLEIDEGRPVESVAPAKAPPDAVALTKSLVEPTGLEDLKTFIEKRKRLLVVVNDHTRPTPSGTVLKHLGLRGKEVTTAIASGSHRSPNAGEMRGILGGEGHRTVAGFSCMTTGKRVR
jgi:nickel-dependent lactate racemase